YAREELKLSDAQVVERVTAARLALELPEVIERLASGELSLASAGELWKALREEKELQKSANQQVGDLRIENRNALQPAFEMASAPSITSSTQGQIQASAMIVATPTAKPVSKAEKKELLQIITGKSRRESETALREWKQERSGVVHAP